MSALVSFTLNPDSQANRQTLVQQSSRSAAYDPVDKLRVSQPQALIDTDFEYGTQPTKWESIALQNNRQSCYYIAQQPITGVSNIAGDGSTRAVVVTTSGTLPNVGSIVYIQNSLDTNANGWYYVTASGAGTFTYQASGIVANGNQYNPANTYVFTGYFYSNCGIQVSASAGAAFTNSGTTVTGTTTYPHGLSAGSYIYVVGTTATTNAPNGAWVVATVPTASTFTFTVINAPTGTITATAGAGVSLYARPSGYVEPRAFDGGVAFSAGATVPNQQLIRQTRRYFRYQSGKGIQFSTGTALKPAIFTTSLTATNFTVTVTTRFPHNLTAGSSISVANVDQPAYNGTYLIASVPSVTTFTYVANSPPPATATGIAIKINPLNWYGSTNRVGFFDQQNGLFFEYDGQTLYAVLRNSINQISGTVQVTQGNGLVTGSGTQFTTQLVPGDYIVIRGQSYRVLTITSDTALYISPEYRGASISQGGYIVSKTIDTKVPQSQWWDVCDGSNSPQNPSGYNIDLTRMQMFYIDYSWYGAGVARFGFRGVNGAVTYVYSFVNNNVRYEAYMRSGNMAAHYESNGITPMTYLTQTLSNSETNTLYVNDTSLFAPSGTVKVQASGTSGVVEYISYTGKTNKTLTGLTRAATGGQGSAQTFTYSATAPISVDYASPDTASSLSHWGSSVIMDGNFNDDKSLIFNYGMTSPLSTSATGSYALMALRVAPSVDNGTTGLLGAKEIINRMQLQLDSLSVVATGNTYLINLILNGTLAAAFSGTGSQATFTQPIQISGGYSSSLAQIAVNGATGTSATIAGGESLAAAYVSAGITTLDLSSVRDMGNSILGGGTSNTVPTSQAGLYPDGPDILYVVATPISATAGTIQARISWKEAQA